MARKKKRRFNAQLTTINRGIEIVMEKMEVEKWDYRRDGDGKAIIAWILDSKEYQVWCTEFDYFDDNLRACERCITLVYRVYDEYKVQAADIPVDLGVFFMGFRVESGKELLALPEPNTAPWVILNVNRDATKGEIKKAFQELIKQHHPDHGGNTAEAERIIKAKEEMLEMRK